MRDYMKAALGKEKVDLVLKNCQIVNVFSGIIEKNDIAVCDGIIVGIGQYEGKEEVDLEGRFVCPGLIDGHVHIESSMVTPPQFAKAVMPHGTTTVIADPHEIANVCGLNGIRFMIEASESIPLDVFFMLPSCVPSTPFENAGAILEAEDLLQLKDNPLVIGLGEMMNYPGVIFGNEMVHDKLEAFSDCRIDGHAPGVKGDSLNAYAAAGVKTDHECTTVEELQEKVNRGMYVHIREGSATKNLLDLIDGITARNSHRLLFCTDDKHPSDIRIDGHINYNIKLAVKNGVDAITAVQMATINSAECYGLKGIGAIAPGYQADMVVVDDLDHFNVLEVYKKGVKVAENQEFLFDVAKTIDESVLNTVHIENVEEIDLDIHLKSDFVRVIELVENNILTENVTRRVDVKDGKFNYNHKLDILKLAVIERHHNTGNIGLGLVEGYGLKNGAVALTVAHDSHNIIVIGDNDADMKVAIAELKRVSGGMTICSEGKVLHTLPLEVAGLMTDSSVKEVEVRVKKLQELAYEKGVTKNIDPYLTLAFLALPVIPDLKLTDRGLFDVTKFEFVDIEV